MRRSCSFFVCVAVLVQPSVRARSAEVLMRLSRVNMCFRCFIRFGLLSKIKKSFVWPSFGLPSPMHYRQIWAPLPKLYMAPLDNAASSLRLFYYWGGVFGRRIWVIDDARGRKHRR